MPRLTPSSLENVESAATPEHSPRARLVGVYYLLLIVWELAFVSLLR